MVSVEQILQSFGPMLSSQLVNKIIEIDKISKVAARQRVSRVRTPVNKLRGINFPNNEKFIYLDDHFGKSKFIEGLYLTLVKSNTAAGRALCGLGSRNGACPMVLFPKIAGSTVYKTKGQLLTKTVFKQLDSSSLIYKITDYEYGDVILDYDCAGFSNHHRAVLKVESIILPAIKSWIVNMGLSSSNAIKIRDDQMPTYGPFCWDITGPSYIHGISKYTRDKKKDPGFIVGDILLGKEITVKDLEPFMYKIDFLSYQKRIKPFIPMLIADFFDFEALNKLRARGVMLGRPETIFGREVAKSLRELIKTIRNAAQVIEKNPEKVSDLFARLMKVEGAALNLRSVVFEFIVAHIFSFEGYNIEMRKVIRTDKGELAEIDVLASKANEVVCVECKGLSSNNLVKREEIEDWVSRPLARIKSWLRENSGYYKGKRKFIFYTSTNYDSEARQLINNIRKTHKRMPILFLNGEDVLKSLSENSQYEYMKIFKEQFVQK